MDDYRQRRRAECQALFQNFRPDLTGCRKPDQVLSILRLAADGLFSHEIAEQLGTTPKAVQKAYRRYNFPVLQNFSPPLREQRRGWAGGVKEVKGYFYSRTPDHPYASKHGSYVAVHRLVMEQKLGRYLLPTEVVDHIDGNTRNNAPENLRVFQSNSEHLRVTLAGRVPKWSEDGKQRILNALHSQAGRPKPRKRKPPILDPSETDAGQ